MREGTIVVQVNGVQTTVTLPDVEHVTAAQLNEAFCAAGAGVHAHVLTAAERAEFARRQAQWAAQARQANLNALALEDPDEVQQALKELGYSRGRLDGLHDKALNELARHFEPDSY